MQAYRALAKGLLDEYDSETLLAAALKIMTREPEEKPLPVLTEAPPIHLKRVRTPKENNSGYRRSTIPPGKRIIPYPASDMSLGEIVKRKPRKSGTVLACFLQPESKQEPSPDLRALLSAKTYCDCTFVYIAGVSREVQ
jgi:hypothetical protein